MLRQISVSRLLELGWSEARGAAIATKQFATAVGPKEAQVYLEKFPEAFRLTGVYYSEGRNILEPRSVIIPSGADHAAVHTLVDRFVTQGEEAIADSYAARLLRSGSLPSF